ncbi:hypothetical protein CRG98_008884 [Punica granatum]|uniref:Uncharacterized protein n=1 Tax=Punica granatum TaxID=22663 RepID=A0A2I0KQB9_PUNGR|nr:hypothetical protein CRG98_008884 [Punica granatum]
MLARSFFSPLAAILKENKLIGLNYVDWKRNLNIVLIANGYNVLTEPYPEIDDNSTEEELEAKRQWRKTDQMTKCYILASMSNSRPAKQAAIRAIMNTRMAEVASVRDHMLKMISCFNEGDTLGVDINGQSQVDMVLETLTDSFRQFKLNYNMGMLNMTLPKLMKKLQAVEAITEPQSTVQLAQSSTLRLKSKGGKILEPLTMSVTPLKGSGRQGDSVKESMACAWGLEQEYGLL